MKQTVRGLLVAGVPVTLGILFGIGVIIYGIQAGQKEEAAKDKTQKENKSAAPTADSNPMKSFVTQNCSSCHGQELKGGFGPSLIKAGQNLSEEQIVEILKNGKGNMPKGLATGKEADVAKYLKSLK